MANLHGLTFERHGQKFWQRPTNFRFAAAESVIPLVVFELSKAAMSMPLAFVSQGDSFIPVAVMGIEPGNNVFVSADWRWLGQYVPAQFRSYPFRLVKTDDGQNALCVDEDNDLICDVPTGERFFNDDNAPSQAVEDIIEFLRQIEQSRKVTENACLVLQKHALIRAWPITVQQNTGVQLIEGLYEIDEAALNQLSAEALKEVQEGGGLAVAYCQLISIQHLPLLGQLTDKQKAASAQMSPLHTLSSDGTLDLEFFNKGGTFNFSKL